MQTDLIEKWNELCKCISKPLTEQAQLNISTLNELVKHTNIDELTQEKFTNHTIKLVNQYAHKAGEIWQTAATESNNIINEILNGAINKVSADMDIFKQNINKAQENTKQTSKHK